MPPKSPSDGLTSSGAPYSTPWRPTSTWRGWASSKPVAKADDGTGGR